MLVLMTYSWTKKWCYGNMGMDVPNVPPDALRRRVGATLWQIVVPGGSSQQELCEGGGGHVTWNKSSGNMNQEVWKLDCTMQRIMYQVCLLEQLLALCLLNEIQAFQLSTFLEKVNRVMKYLSILVYRRG